MDIPDHLYESEWANQSGSMRDSIHADEKHWEKHWLEISDDYADPDTEPIPGLG